MRTLKMFIVRWKSCIRKPWAWAFVIIAMAAAVVPVISARFDTPDTLPIALVNKDNDVLSMKLEENMERFDELTLYHLDYETAMRYLAMGRVEGAFVIESYFTQQLEKGNYEDVITMYTSPASTAAVTLSETLIDSTMMIWIEEMAMLEMKDFLRDQGLPFEPEQQRQMRADFNEMLTTGSMITIDEHIPEPAQTPVGEYEILIRGTAWYAAFSVLFIIISAGWVIDSRRRVMGERMRSAGIHPLSAMLGSSLAIVALSMAGWLMVDGVLCGLLDQSWVHSLKLALPMLIYMAGIMGITLVIASSLSRVVQLMLVAPVFTMVHGVVCGMLMTLPDWAATLVYLSDLLPGRWLMMSAGAVMTGQHLSYLLWQAVCSLLWLLLGAAVSVAGARRTRLAAE